MRSAVTRVRLLALLLAGSALIGATRSIRDRSPMPALQSAVPPAPPARPDLGTRAVAVTENNPFRWDHRPASPRYGSAAPEATAPPADTTSRMVTRPDWKLTGILWGNPPVAVFEGVTAHEGPGIFTAGDTAGGVQITVIWPDSVLLRQGERAWTYVLAPAAREGGTT